jgi:hypothetical protein
MKSPTEKQIALVEAITKVLGIDFPQSSWDFNIATYSKFISNHIDEFRQVIEDYNDIGEDDEMMWFQMLNG